MSLILFTQRYVFIRKMQLYFIKYLYFSATTSLLIRTIQGFRLFHSCPGQTHYIFYYILVCNFLTILLVINILSFANVDYFPYLYKIY